MALTKAQAIEAGNNPGTEIHYIGCWRKVGPRGGIVDHIEKYRSNGKCQTWKTRPDHFRLPVKAGFRIHGYVDHVNADRVHLASECPLLEQN